MRKSYKEIVAGFVATQAALEVGLNYRLPVDLDALDKGKIHKLKETPQVWFGGRF